MQITNFHFFLNLNIKFLNNQWTSANTKWLCQTSDLLSQMQNQLSGTFYLIWQRETIFYSYYMHSPTPGMHLHKHQMYLYEGNRLGNANTSSEKEMSDSQEHFLTYFTCSFQAVHSPANSVFSLFHTVNQTNIFLAAGWKPPAALCWFKIITASKASANSHRRTPLFITEEQRKIMPPHYSSSNII